MSDEARAFVVGILGVPILLGLLLVAVYGSETWGVLAIIGSRAPLLLSGSPDFGSAYGGFAANIAISVCAMVLSIIGGTILGIGLISHQRSIRIFSSFAMNVLRNSPWLVVLYAMLYLLPFELTVVGHTIFLSPLVKATIGLSLPVAANVAEVFRGGVEAIPSGQWESARSLGYSRNEVLRYVIVPQALPMMTPNLMTTYAMLFIGTSLVVVTGTTDVLSVARTVIASDGARVATGVYLFVLLLFFLFCFPIAILTRWLEIRVRGQR